MCAVNCRMCRERGVRVLTEADVATVTEALSRTVIPVDLSRFHIDDDE